MHLLNILLDKSRRARVGLILTYNYGHGRNNFSKLLVYLPHGVTKLNLFS